MAHTPARAAAGGPFLRQLADMYPQRLPRTYFCALADRLARDNTLNTDGAPTLLEGAPRWPRRALYSDLTCAQLFDPVLRQKAVFLERQQTYAGSVYQCHLCGEPAGTHAHAHCSYWDHLTRYVGLRLTANYLADAGRAGQAPAPAAEAPSPPPPPSARPTSASSVAHPAQQGPRRAVLSKSRVSSPVATSHGPAAGDACSSGLDERAGQGPVRWYAASVLADAERSLLSRPRLPARRRRAAPRASASAAAALTGVFECEDTARRAQLAAVLALLAQTPREGHAACGARTRTDRLNAPQRCAPGSPHGVASRGARPPRRARDGLASSQKSVLHDSLRAARGASAAANLGERTFRAFVSRTVTPLLPPMGAEATTRVQQRCWGRRNLERLYNALNVAALQVAAGGRAETAKNARGSTMRQIIHELVMVHALLERAGGEADTDAGVGGGCEEERAYISPPVKLLLIEEALQRLAFELVYLQSSEFMQSVWPTYAQTGFPAEKELEASGYY